MLPSLLAGLGGVALFLAAGWGITSRIAGLRALPAPRRCGYAYLLGVSALGTLLYAGSHWAGLPLRRGVILLLTLGVAALSLLPRHARPVPLPPLSPERYGPRRSLHRTLRLGGAALCTLVVLGVLAEGVSRAPEDWDGRMTWSVRARHIRAEGTVDPQVLTDPRWSASHPRYPVLLPLAQAVLQEAFGTEDDSPGFRALYAAFLAALFLVVYDGARRWSGPLAAALVTALLAATPFYSFGHEGGAVSAYSDLPLAAFWGGGLLLLLRGVRRRGSSGMALAAGLLLAAAALTKNEGTVLALAALALGLLRARPWTAGPGSTRAWLRLGTAGLILFLALALRHDWKAGIPNRDDEDYSRLLALDAGALLSRVPSHVAAALPVALKQGLAWPDWHLLPWLAFAFLGLGRSGFGGRRRPLALLLLAAMALPPAVAWAAYALHWEPARLAAVTWNRFLLQSTPPFALLLALALRGALGARRRCTGLPPGTSLAKALSQ